MPSRPLLIGGVLLLVLGLLGEFLIFPGMLASDGGEFAAQISSSGDIETFNDYDVGDSVTIVDTVARIQLDEGQTRVWLASIGAADTDIAFRFNGDLLADFGPDDKVVISFEVAQFGSGETPAGYETSAEALPADAIAPRYSSTTELAFAGLAALGLALVAFGGFNSWRGGGEEPEDDWGAPAVPMAAPPAMTPAAPAMAAAAPAAAAPVAQPVTIQCPACQAGLQINDPTRPLNISCPGCGAGMVVR
ncbi:MAG: hypothetical protein BEU05_02460 [Marine Group III euryarchaeote CG-Bathy2]|uniref:Uncharacterized protein n=1 Tax=Marine Group III euryarchaeote CG-Bathy2 TaxID=1889002 RepID=A0A1J5SMB3_9ARCH|nr:MAG: hypothetical protein BEU05_02460 [Marine Group III euryarchaeote CG-Bathy2]